MGNNLENQNQLKTNTNAPSNQPTKPNPALKSWALKREEMDMEKDRERRADGHGKEERKEGKWSWGKGERKGE